MTFTEYKEAHAFAVKRANELKIAQGIEFCKYDKRWVVRSIPKRENRFGCDARCEAVEVGSF